VGGKELANTNTFLFELFKKMKGAVLALLFFWVKDVVKTAGFFFDRLRLGEAVGSW
jgi:hypothetical protein